MSGNQKVRTAIFRLFLCLLGMGSAGLSLTAAEPAFAAPTATVNSNPATLKADLAVATAEQAESSAATLVAQWNLDAGSGTQLRDEVSGSKGGAIAGARWSPFAPLLSGREKSLSFDGDDDHADTGKTFDIDNDFTITAWVYPQSYAANNIVGKHTGGGANQVLVGLYDGGYHVRIRSATLTVVQPVDGWQHIAVTGEETAAGTVVKVYRDGILLHEEELAEKAGAIGGGKAWTIGQDWDGDTRTDFFKGNIGEVRIYNGALSQAELDSILDFTNIRVANDDFWSNAGALSCFTALGIAHNAAWGAGWTAPPPLDVPLDAAVYSTNLALKLCAPYISPWSNLVFDRPEDTEQCTVTLDQSAMGGSYSNVLGLPFPTSDILPGTNWGALGTPEVVHWNTDVELSARYPGWFDEGKGELTFGTGVNAVTWRGDTMVHPLDFIPIYWPGPNPDRKSMQTAIDIAEELIDIVGGAVIDSPIEPYGIYNEEVQYVVVKDFVAPTISVTPSLADVSVEAIEPGGVSRARFEHILRSGLAYSDNCDDDPTVSAIGLPLFASVGEVYTITWKAEDDGPRTANGGRNNATVQQILRVVDTKPPIMLAPPAIVTETVTIPAAIDIGHPGVFDLADLNPTVSHNACAQPDVICPAVGLPQFPAGQTTVTWTAADQSGNSASVTQLVNVKAPGANNTPTADAQSAEAISFEPITLTLTADDVDADPLWFSTVTQPADGFFKAPLLPYFIADYRVEAKGVVLHEYCEEHPGETVYTNWPVDAEWMAVDDDDNVYVFDNGGVVCDGSDGSVHQEYRVAKIMPDGTYIQTGPSAVPDTTKSIYIDYRRGHIVAADPGNNHGNPWVHQFDLETLETVGHFRVDYATYPPGTTNGLDTADHALADEQGILYVSGHNRIWLFDTNFPAPYDNNPMHGLVEYADFDWQEVNGLALDSDLNFYVSVGGGRIYKWSPATLDADHNFTPGEFVGWLGACSEGPDCDVANQRSFGYRCTDATCTGPMTGSKPGQFGGARGIAMGPNDILYVTDSGNQRVQRFTQNGYFAGQAVSECDGSCFTLGDFGRPKQVTVNTNHFYVLDTSSDLLHIFETTPIKPLDDTTAEVVYQSNNNFVGTDSFLYQVTDGLAASSPATVTIDVARNFRPPQTYRYEEPYQTDEDQAVTIPLQGYDPDESFDTLTYQIVTEPEHGTVTSDGVYTPAPDFHGTDTFQFVANDGTFQSEPRTVTVTVSAVNDPPRFPSESARSLAYRAATGATFNPTRLMTLDEVTVGRGFMAAFTVEYSDPDKAELHTVRIDWGDGEVEGEGKALEDGTITGPLLLQSAADAPGMVTANHIYNTSGDYTLQICITDNMEMVEGEKLPTAASTTSCKEIAVSVADMVDLTVDLDSAHNPLTPEEPLILTANVLNPAPEQGEGIAATDVRVTVALPKEATYVAAITAEGTCQQNAGELVCQMDNLAPGSSAEIVIQATVDNHVVGDTLEATAIVETSATNQVEASFDYEKIVLVGTADYVVDTVADTADADPNDGLCTDSDGNCSLRAAIEQANNSDGSRIIALGDGLYEVSEALTASGDIELVGLGATRTIVRNKDAEKVFLSDSGSVTIRNMSISGGVLNLEADLVLDNVAISGSNGQEPNYGGGLYNVRGNTTVRNSSISGNRATQGGGIYNGGTLTLVNVTVSGNSADAHGGVSNNGTANLTHVTISHNQAQSGAGGLGLGASASITLQHTLVGKNTVGTTPADCTGSFTSSGHNLLESGCESSLASSDLSGADPRLETLNLNDGETLTVGLQEDSPALDAGGSTVSVDQRGVARDDAADIGAYERVTLPQAIYLPVVLR